MINFKRISAIATGLLMIGMTAGVAAAATYPLPFVENNVANVAIVYGADSPNSLDLVPATSISADLSTYITATAGTTGTTPSGDPGLSVLLAKSSDNLNLGNMWSVFTGTVDKDDLKTLLAAGNYVAGDNDEFAYEQKIILGAPNLTHFRDSDYENQAGLTAKTPVVGFKIASSTFIMNYTIDFTSNAQSDIVSSRLDDIEGSNLPLFGKKYYVSRLNNGTGTRDFLGTLTLLDSANTATITQGETLTITGHKINIDYIDNDEVAFIVDGVRTPSNGKLKKGDSAKLADGNYVGVTDISKLEVSGETGTTTFSIGSGKLEIASSTGGTDVKMNDVAVQGVRGYVYADTSPTDGTEKVDKIVIEWKSDEEMFLTPGKELNMPGFTSIKFTMGDFVRPIEEKISISKDSDLSMEMTVPIKDGDVNFNFLYANASGEFVGIGKDADERLATSWNTSLLYYEKNDSGHDFHRYFVATYNTTSQAESYLLRAKVTYDSTDGRNETTIEKNVAGTWTTACEGKIATDTCSIGDVDLTIGVVEYISGQMESVELRATNADNVNFNTIVTKGGLTIYLPIIINGSAVTRLGGIGVTISSAGAGAAGTYDVVNQSQLGWNSTDAGHGYDSFYLAMDGEDKDANMIGGLGFDLTIDDTSTPALQVSQVKRSGNGGAAGLELAETQTYEAYIVDDIAPRVLHYTNPDEDYAEVYYPIGDSESYGQVYLAEKDVSVSSSGATAKLGEVIIKDSEVSTMSSKNLIVVGGSCVNDVAANLIGGAKCTTAWETSTGVGAGKYLIQSYTSPYATGKVAVLVAGYEAADTVNAQKALTANKPDVTVGKKYTGTSASDMKAA